MTSGTEMAENSNTAFFCSLSFLIGFPAWSKGTCEKPGTNIWIFILERKIIKQTYEVTYTGFPYLDVSATGKFFIFLYRVSKYNLWENKEKQRHTSHT